MNRAKIIYALRKYTHKEDLDAMLTWSTSALEKYLAFMEAVEEYGRARHAITGNKNSWGVDR